jgi:hypothetical protein
MQTVVAILVIIYLVGVGVVLAPTVRENWNSATTPHFFASIGDDMPRALSWPVRVYHHAERG